MTKLEKKERNKTNNKEVKTKTKTFLPNSSKTLFILMLINKK